VLKGPEPKENLNHDFQTYKQSLGARTNNERKMKNKKRDPKKKCGGRKE